MKEFACTVAVCACILTLAHYESGPRGGAMATETSCESMADVARQAARIGVGIGTDSVKRKTRYVDPDAGEQLPNGGK